MPLPTILTSQKPDAIPSVCCQDSGQRQCCEKVEHVDLAEVQTPSAVQGSVSVPSLTSEPEDMETWWETDMAAFHIEDYW